MNDMSPQLTVAGVQDYAVSAPEYCAMIAAGLFGDAHVELVEGRLVQMAPSGMDHGRANADIAIDLAAIYRPLGMNVVFDVIVELTGDTVRSPDVSVIDRDIGGRQKLLPDDILLAVEVSNTTLAEDIGRKRADYAAAGIRNYWVVDLTGRRVHSYADPVGADYATITIAKFGEPLVAPATDRTITVS